MNAVNDKGSAPLAFCSWIMESYDLHQMTHRDFSANSLPQGTLLIKASRHTECVSVPSPCIGEAAGEDAEDLAGVGRGQHLDAGDPFDPFEAATARGD